MKTRIILVVVALLSWSVCAQADVMVYNANDEFSLSEGNPNGVWTYGKNSAASVYAGTDIFGTPTDWTARANGDSASIDSWQSGATAYDPSVTHNGTSTAASCFGFTWQPNDIGLDSYGGDTLIQWKAPTAGTAVVHALFSASNATVYEYLNGVRIKAVSNTSGTEWTDTFTVEAGDAITFGAGGGTVTMFHETVTLTTIPEPGTLMLLASGLVGLLAYAWRKRRCVPS